MTLGFVALLAGACSSPTQSRAQAVAGWASAASLVPNDALVAGDVLDVARGIRARELAATHTACDGLAADAATALGELPTPDTILTDDLNRAYLDFARAAQACSVSGRSTGTAFARYDRLATAGSGALAAGERRYRSLVG